MDQLVADVSRAGQVRIGDEAVILGKQKKQEISADELARLAQTINYEIVCSLGNRLPRVYKKKK
jgi:alanine racemase